MGLHVVNSVLHVKEKKKNLPSAEELGLVVQDVLERLGKDRLWIVQTAHALAEQMVRRGVERESEEQRLHVHHAASLGVIIRAHQLDQLVDVHLEHLRVDQPVARKHGPDEGARARPQLAVGREDAVSQELVPLLVELFALAIVCEFPRQHGLDVLRVDGEDGAGERAQTQLDGVRGLAVGQGVVFEDALPEDEVLCLDGFLLRAVDEVEAWEVSIYYRS